MRVCVQCSLVVAPSHVSFIYLVMNMHYRKTQICRVSWPLPSTRTRTLGKDVLCRVPGHEHSANICHTACPSFVECWLSATNGTQQTVTFAECWLGGTRQIRRTCPARAPAVRRPLGGADGVKSLPSATTWHSAKGIVCRVPSLDTRQIFFCRVLELRYSAKLGKKIFWPSKFFGL